MAFNNIYTGAFTNSEGSDCVIQIQEDGFAGSVKEMVLAGTPCIINTTQTDLHEPIQGLGCEVSLISEEGDDYSHLFLAPPHTYKIVVTIDLDIIFQGFIDNEFYTEEFLAPPYEINLTASDGLKGLEVYNPNFLLESSTRLMSTLSECLKSTALSLPIEIKCSLMAEDMDIMDGSGIMTRSHQVDTLFSRSQVFAEAFDGLTTRGVLEELLKPFNCKVYQDGTVWRVDRLNDKYFHSDNTKYIRYTADGVLDFNQSGVGSVGLVSIGGDPHSTNNYWMNGNQIMEKQQPYYSQTINGKLTDNGDRLHGVETSYIENIWATEPSVSLANLDNVVTYCTFMNTESLSVASALLNGHYADNNSMVYENGAYNFDSEDIENMMGNDENHWWNTFVGYKVAVSFENWKEGKVSDSITFSHNVNGTRGNASGLFGDKFVGWKEQYTKHRSVIVIEKPDGSRKWLRWNGSDKGYIFEDYDNNHRESYFIEKNIDTLDSLWGKLESTNISYTMTNSKKSKYSRDSLDINDSLEEYTAMYYMVYYPYVYFLGILYNSSIVERYVGGGDVWMNGGVDIEGTQITYDSLSEYNNTFTAVLSEASTAREAESLDLSLWNPVKIGSGEKIRGLVSETSSWTTRNLYSNIFKCYGQYLSIKNIDEYAGLGLWFDVDDLYTNGTTTDLGNRLPANLLASYFTTFSNIQEIYTGDICTLKPLSYRDVYSVVSATSGKQFMIQSANFDVRTNTSTIRLFELHADTITVNT